MTKPVSTLGVRWQAQRDTAFNLFDEKLVLSAVAASLCRRTPKRATAILLVTLISLTLCPAMETASAQGKKRLADYVNRPAPPVSPETRKEMEARLGEARRHFEAKPNDPGARIWLGRRLAYLGRFNEAIEVYSEGIKKFPWDARFYRHRGHRYITLRKFDLAIADFEKAAQLIKGKPDEVEPDGQPNVRNIPTSTLHFNIWYHLGLSYYLTGQNERALNGYRECMNVSKNPDALVATSHWLYMTLRRMNREPEAAKVLEPISEGMEIIENDGYYRLLLMYKGAVSAADLLAETLKQTGSAGTNSILYGIGNWYLYNGRRDEAVKVFRQMVTGDQWTSFGYIAAEADLKNLFDRESVTTRQLHENSVSDNTQSGRRTLSPPQP